MKQINWEDANLDDHPDYADDIARAVDNLADCIEIFLPHEKAKSGSDPRAIVPDAMFGPHTSYDAAVSVEQLINPMREQHGCITGSLRVFAPLWAIRQELWRLYELQGWNDIPTNQLPAGPDKAISSMALPSSFISGMSQRYRILARLLAYAAGGSAPTTAAVREKVPTIVVTAMAQATPESSAEETPESSAEQRAIGVLVIHPKWSKKRLAEEVGCHPKTLSKGRAPLLHSAIEAYKMRDLPRGEKAPDGTVEAWEEAP